MSIVVSDTSPLHYLILCGAENTLPQLFQRVIIPPTVFSELRNPNAPAAVRDWAATLPDWVKIQKPEKLDAFLNLDLGELEAISLALEIKADVVLMDDLKGRNAARQRGLSGVLEAAATRNMIDLPRTLAQLQRTNARLDPDLIRAALQRDQDRRNRT